MIRTTMELGGHAPVVVLDDADVERVAAYAAMAKFFNAGQVCVSPTRFSVHEAVYDRFVAVFSDRARSLVVGDGLRKGTQVGPLAHVRRPAAMEAFVEDASTRGGRVITGGHRLPGPGFFWAPTVLADVPAQARVMNEEPFGPLAVINRVSNVDEAIAEANRLPYGLAAYAFTGSARAARRLSEGIEAGMVGINTFSVSTPEAPFGGVKASGHGSEEGIEGLAGHLVTKSVYER
jgi:succinate-semialdehyde dehydrogenase/glutarate-semialdehyde dehydrogenase